MNSFQHCVSIVSTGALVCTIYNPIFKKKGFENYNTTNKTSNTEKGTKIQGK